MQGSVLSVWKREDWVQSSVGVRDACTWVLGVSQVDRKNGQESNLIQDISSAIPKHPKRGVYGSTSTCSFYYYSLQECAAVGGF